MVEMAMARVVREIKIAAAMLGWEWSRPASVGFILPTTRSPDRFTRGAPE
jgi:hypothetical protein